LLSVEEQLKVIRRGVEEIISEEELKEKLSYSIKKISP